MTGSTSPLGFPYLTPADNLSQLAFVMQQLAEAVDDYLSALSAVAPVAFTGLTLNGGWTGGAEYARRAGMVTVSLHVTSASPGTPWPPDYPIATLPPGFRPSVPAYGACQSGGSPRFVYVTAGGVVCTNEAATGSVFGTFTYPV